MEFVEGAISRAQSSDVDPWLPKAIVEYQGMSGQKTRHLYNALCSRPGTRYLEVGTWHGSSTISALYGNTVDHAILIDNFSEFDGTVEVLQEALDTYCPEAQVTIIKEDAFQVDTSILPTFNVYLYDGDHSEASHKEAIVRFYPNLEDGCIVLIDDFAWTGVRAGTFAAFTELGMPISYYKEILPDPVTSTDSVGFWNGVGIFIIRKC